MKMGADSTNSWHKCILDLLQTSSNLVDEKIEKERLQVKACKKKTELDTKLAQELKLHNELSEHFSELSRRGTDLDRVCATFETHVTIADSDRNRLDNAKDAYKLGKELTGMRLDFSSTPNIAKGYIKSDSRKLLQPFEVPAGDSDALWAIVQATAAPGWPDKENQPDN